MKGVTGPHSWLPLCLLLPLVGSSAAQAPQPQKPPDQPGVELPAFLSAQPLKEDSKDDELRKLLKARYNAALGELKGLYKERLLPGVDRLDNLDDLYGPWQRLVQAGLELCDTPVEKVAVLTPYVEMTKETEKTEQARYEAGRVTITSLHRARYQRLDAEIQLLRAKREADKAKAK